MNNKGNEMTEKKKKRKTMLKKKVKARKKEGQSGGVIGVTWGIKK